jgi:hypothetical protein
MRKTKWTLVCLISLALLGAPQAFAAGKGQGQGQGKGDQAVGTQTQGQWGTNQPPGWDSQGKKKGWTKKDPNSTMPGGLNKNQLDKGKYPKGLEKPR